MILLVFVIMKLLITDVFTLAKLICITFDIPWPNKITVVHLCLKLGKKNQCRHINNNNNQKNYNFLACDWFKEVLFSTNLLAKLLSDSLLLVSLLSDSSKTQSHSKI